MEHLYEKDPLIQKIAAAEEICWINEKKRSTSGDCGRN